MKRRTNNLRQHRPNQLSAERARELRKNCDSLKTGSGFDYGWFFDTCGRASVERINPLAQYAYGYRTDADPPGSPAARTPLEKAEDEAFFRVVDAILAADHQTRPS